MAFYGKSLLKLGAMLGVAVAILSLSCAKTPEQTPSPASPATPTSGQPATPIPTAVSLPRPAGDPVAGEKVFNAQGCNACHVAKGSGGQVAPKLDGFYGSMVKLTTGKEVLADEAYIRESIVNPGAKVAEKYQPIMPTSFASLPPQDLQNLVAFIASLAK